MSRPWTEAHRREAWCRIFELTAKALRECPEPRRPTLPLDPEPRVSSEDAYRAVGLDRFGFDAARINREVRRVRSLAEGRLVRETKWLARSRLGDVSDERDTREALVADLAANGRTRTANGDRIVRVTRIRRA